MCGTKFAANGHVCTTRLGEAGSKSSDFDPAACRQASGGAVVTPGFKGKPECIEHMCARIKFHTCVDSVYTKTQCKP
jgi:hypothetical protein